MLYSLPLQLAAQPTWTAHDTRLTAAALAGIAVIVVLISWAKLHPFLSLALGAATLGAVAGMPFSDLVESFTDGVGSTVGDVGLLVALGAMLGKLLTDSGGAEEVVETVLRRTTRRTLPWAMVFIAALLGLPMFFEVGVVLLIPIVMMVASRSEQPVLRIGIPALAGLSILHGLVPPHPGPLAAVDALQVDLGLTLALGIVVAIPTAIIAGPLFGTFISRRVQLPPATNLLGTSTEEPTGERPGFFSSVAMLLLPVVLMLGKSVADLLLAENTLGYRVLETIGEPVVALTITVLIAIVVLGRGAGLTRKRVSDIVGGALPPIAGIILIVGAGGGFKQTLVDSGVNETITDLATGAHLSPPGPRLAHRGRHPGGHRFGDSGHHLRGRHGRAPGGRARPGARRPGGAGDRRRIAVPVPRQRRRVLAGEGVLRDDGRPDPEDLVGDGDPALGGRLRDDLAALRPAVGLHRGRREATASA